MKKQKKQPKHLLQGEESSNKIELLLELTNITSENGKSAIIDHLVKGYTIKDAKEINNHEHLSRDLKILNKVTGIVYKIEDLDFARFKK